MCGRACPQTVWSVFGESYKCLTCNINFSFNLILFNLNIVLIIFDLFVKEEKCVKIIHSRAILSALCGQTILGFIYLLKRENTVGVKAYILKLYLKSTLSPL